VFSVSKKREGLLHMGSRRIVTAVVGCALLALAVTASAQARVLRISEFKLSSQNLAQIRRHQMDRLLATHRMHTWAPIPTKLTDSDLKLMGLPPKRFLLGKRFPVPTAVYPSGKMVRLTAGAKGKKPKGGGGSSNGTSASETPVTTFAGTGFFGIRPGAWLLTITDQEIGWCSMAHVYGTPGSYAISTAGHCGKSGDLGTVIGVVGDHSQGVGAQVPVLLDFGKYCSSTGDAGIGKDWALICVDPEDQSLVTPTMAFWGGPIGMFTSTGSVVSADLTKGSVSTDPNPTLVQQIVHYGHGAGIGAGGTPRSGTALNWFSNYFTWFGAITPGDSGSGSNVLTGDALGDNREAAGINTHIFVDASLRTGLGDVASTRATLVNGTLANGQILPYPAPLPILP
jgi:hypothetical protein